MTESTNPPNLHGRVAVVTGASRGAGRGIALELGAAGATVYVTGRSTRAEPADSYGPLLALSGLAAVPGSIDDTADELSRLGGQGIAVRCDHGREDEVAALFERVQREQGRLDLLVNNAWGGHESFDGVFDAPFWQHPPAHWNSMLDRGARHHLIASRAAAPLLVRQGRGLIVTTTFWDRDRYLRGNLYYDLAKAAMNRLAFGLAEELRPHGIASLALSPGWMRTEFVLSGHRTDEAHWRERPALARTESPRYLGRAVAALAADPRVLRKSGRVHRVADLAREYGFTDIDGRQVEAFELDRPAAAPPAAAEAGALVFAREPELPVDEFRQLLIDSGLGATRPVDDRPRLQAMLSGAGLVLTARAAQPGAPLLGVARCLTDFAWNAWVSELAVAASAQGQGVGSGLLDELRRQLGRQVSVTLAAVPEAAGFYDRLGMPRLPDTFCWRREA